MAEGKHVERPAKKWAKEHGWLVRKLRYQGRRSASDNLFAKNGRLLFVEFKDHGKSPTELQAYEHRQLREAGMDVRWYDSFEAFKHDFEELERQFELEWLH